MSDDGRVDLADFLTFPEPGRDVYRFPNNYGASVIHLRGGQELAMLWFDGDQQVVRHMHGLVHDVVKLRDDAHLTELLERIAALPA